MSDVEYVVETLAAPCLLAALLWVDSLSAFLLALVALQFLVWPLYATRRGRPAGPGTPTLSATSLGRAWFFGLWVLLLGTVFLESRSARLLVSVVLASTAAAAVLTARLVQRAGKRTLRTSRSPLPS